MIQQLGECQSFLFSHDSDLNASLFCVCDAGFPPFVPLTHSTSISSSGSSNSNDNGNGNGNGVFQGDGDGVHSEFAQMFAFHDSSLFCAELGVDSLVTQAPHHVFSNSQFLSMLAATNDLADSDTMHPSFLEAKPEPLSCPPAVPAAAMQTRFDDCKLESQACESAARGMLPLHVESAPTPLGDVAVPSMGVAHVPSGVFGKAMWFRGCRILVRWKHGCESSSYVGDVMPEVLGNMTNRIGVSLSLPDVDADVDADADADAPMELLHDDDDTRTSCAGTRGAVLAVHGSWTCHLYLLDDKDNCSGLNIMKTKSGTLVTRGPMSMLLSSPTHHHHHDHHDHQQQQPRTNCTFEAFTMPCATIGKRTSLQFAVVFRDAATGEDLFEVFSSKFKVLARQRKTIEEKERRKMAVSKRNNGVARASPRK
eukprot:ANDGO_02502.mRNA.1 hypothetical protein